MAKQAVSVTLDVENLTWLKGRAVAGGHRSMSELLDGIVSAARRGGDTAGARSVAGTIDIDASDPMLEAADAAVRDLFERSLARPLVVREHAPSYGAPAKRKKRRG